MQKTIVAAGNKLKIVEEKGEKCIKTGKIPLNSQL